ncbi:MAG TPA: hypothetical protein VMC61_05850, partial [Methanocella sp.]|nr:hypothetical protein [Methanocella sp.]
LEAALEAGNGNAPPAVQEERQAPAQAASKPQGTRRIKKLQQNPATGVIEEVEVEDNPADHFIVADGHGHFASAKEGPQHKKSVFIAATDDEPVKK